MAQSGVAVAKEAKPSRARAAQPGSMTSKNYVGGYQNHGTFLGTLKNPCRIVTGYPKRVILTATHVGLLSFLYLDNVGTGRYIGIIKWTHEDSEVLLLKKP